MIKGPRKHGNEARSKFTALENHFLNTFFSGLYLSQGDFMSIAKRLGIEMQMNTRELQIKELLNTAYDKDVLTQAIGMLNNLIDERIQTYHRLSMDYPHARGVLAKLAQKATGTKNLLARESRGNPYE
jgi:hypothetical protein